MGRSRTTRVKGQPSLNPLGRTPIIPELRHIKTIGADEIKRKVSECFRMTDKELNSILDDPDATALNQCLAKQMQLAKAGAKAEFDFLLNRCVGKVRDTMELIYPEPVIVRRSDGTKVEMTTKRIEE